jgi:hypothetical protein
MLNELAQAASSRMLTRSFIPWYDRICDDAVKNRDVALLNWLRSIDHPDEKTACCVRCVGCMGLIGYIAMGI